MHGDSASQISELHIWMDQVKLPDLIIKKKYSELELWIMFKTRQKCDPDRL